MCQFKGSIPWIIYIHQREKFNFNYPTAEMIPHGDQRNSSWSVGHDQRALTLMATCLAFAPPSQAVQLILYLCILYNINFFLSVWTIFDVCFRIDLPRWKWHPFMNISTTLFSGFFSFPTHIFRIFVILPFRNYQQHRMLPCYPFFLLLQKLYMKKTGEIEQVFCIHNLLSMVI